MSTAHWGEQPIREEAVGAANASFGFLADLTSNISEVIQRHQVSAANRELARQLVQQVLDFGERGENQLRGLRDHIRKLVDHVDTLEEDNQQLRVDLEQALRDAAKLRDELTLVRSNADAFEHQRDEAVRDLNGMRRYHQSINPRFALQEQRFAELKAELEAYRLIVGKSPDGQILTQQVEQAAGQPPAYEEALALLVEKTQQHALDCCAFLRTISAENNWPEDAFWHHSSVIDECVYYSRDFYADPDKRDLEPARRLIEAAKTLHSNVVLTSKISEMMPFFGSLITKADDAWREESRLRQQQFGSLVDLCRKVCAVVREDYRDDALLNEARLSMLKAIEDYSTINEQVGSMDLGRLIDTPTPQASAAADVLVCAEKLSVAIARHEPGRAELIDDLIRSATEVLKRTSPQCVSPPAAGGDA